VGKGIGQRRHKRIKVVLPVRICGKDAANNPVNELVHTLDITPNGARLGAIHQVLKTGDKLTLQYRQRRIQFRVVWVKPLEGTNEYQVGLEGISATGDNGGASSCLTAMWWMNTRIRQFLAGPATKLSSVSRPPEYLQPSEFVFPRFVIV